jgi:hypothetical protein
MGSTFQGSNFYSGVSGWSGAASIAPYANAFNRALNGSNAIVVYTGVGFKPKYIQFKWC